MENKIKPSQVMTIFFIVLMIVTVVYAGITELTEITDSKIVEESVKEKLESDVFIDYIRSVDSVRISNDNETDEIFKSYYTDEKRIILEDDNYEVKLNMTLDTKYKERISVGESVRFAELTYENYTEFDDIELYSIDEDYKRVQKNITTKYKTIEEHTDCKSVESNLSKGEFTEVCTTYNTTTYTEFNNKEDLPSTNITIGLFTNTIKGEHIEWVAVKDGFRFYEFASYLVTDIVSYYKLDEGAVDFGTIIDSIDFLNGTKVGATNTTGIIKNAYSFDGNDYIDFNNSNHVTGNYFSISVWIKTTSTGVTQTIYRKRPTEIYMRVSTDNKIYFTGGGALGLVSTSTVTNGNWHHIVGVIDNGDIMLYIDSSLENNDTDAGSISGGTDYLRIGRNGAYLDYFNGIIDEVAIWSIALNATAVEDLYNNGNYLSYPFDPIIYCNFSGYVFDESSNALNNSNITIWNQNNVSDYYETATNASGYWIKGIENSTNTYMVGAYYNNTLVGKLKPYISGTC